MVAAQGSRRSRHHVQVQHPNLPHGAHQRATENIGEHAVLRATRQGVRRGGGVHAARLRRGAGRLCLLVKRAHEEAVQPHPRRDLGDGAAGD